ncbi:MAG TPA: glycosyltransferase [Dongiaceae bacterium]|jgi:glycosyltransferase involved in cell wall biosynthesis|nr:glycosyltransferase [Dongiaceae bacterium]
MANILFVHNNFPGRFAFLLPSLLSAGHRCAAIAQGGRQVDGIPLMLWKSGRASTPEILDLAVRAEADLIRGRAAADRALELKESGFEPDLIIGHPAWGEAAFMKDIFPHARQILVGELYYRSTGGDADFDPEFNDGGVIDPFKVHAKNAVMAMSYAEADRIIFPTPFQGSGFPPAFRERALVIHEGIDLDFINRRPGARLRLNGATELDGSTPVVTFINRVFEPMRGFHVMMRALPALLQAVPNVTVIMIGKDAGAGYGMAAPGGGTWRSHMMKEVGERLDTARVVFTGQVPHETMLAALSLSWAHVYYTYPFVLSWSALEAMACECLFLGSDTPPVRDAVEHCKNGLLHDFFDIGALSQAMIDACLHPERYPTLRTAARRTVAEHYDQRRVCLPAWLKVIDGLL